MRLGYPHLGLLVLPVLASACGPQPYTLIRDQTPEAGWAAAEPEILTNVRQLTNQTLGITKAGEAYFAPDVQRVIFQAFPTGENQYQMYTLELAEDGHARPETMKKVSPGGGACTCGFFRPDGSGIIYASNFLNPDMPNPDSFHRKGSGYVWPMPGGTDVIVADPDGSNPRQLTTEPGYDAECAYSPSGETIVFSSVRDGDPDLYIMMADGSEVRQLTNHPGYDGGPFFSPDGTRIIFRRDARLDDHLQVFVINTDGSGERQLTSNSNIVNWAPFWLPNGRSIVFTTSIHGHGNYEVYLMNIETGIHRRVTFSGGFDGLPVISADGKRMMWTGQRGPTRTSQVFLADFTLPDGY